MTACEARWRDALLSSVLPAPGRGLPAFRDVDLTDFWLRFEAAAPLHVRLGLRAAVLVLGALFPLLSGRFCTLAGLDDDAREALVVRAARLPLLSPLLEVAKLVGCLAYFTDARVQAVVRGRQ